MTTTPQQRATTTTTRQGALPRQRREPSLKTESGDRVPTRWDAITWAQELRVGDAKGKAVLWSLVSHGNAAHAVWLSVPTMEAETEMSKSSVKRGVTTLLEQALVVKIESFSDGEFRQDSQTSNLYILNVDEWLHDLGADDGTIDTNRVLARMKYLSEVKGENFLPTGRRFNA